MKENGYCGAILAAGKGSRMAPFSEQFPKPSLPVGNRPLIHHHIETMKSVGIRDIVVLVGHRGFEISKILGDGSSLGVKIRYVEQTQMLGIAHAVGRLEPEIDRPFLLFLGDIFFVPRDLGQMFDRFEEQGGGAILATKEEKDPAAIRKNFSIALDERGYVRRVIEKPRHTTNRLKGVGLYLFDLTVFDAIRRTPRTAMRDEYEITDSIQVMIDDGLPVRAAPSIEDDINLTSPLDLLRCNLQRLPFFPPDTLIGRESRIHPGAKVENSIIGSRVTVRNPIHISNSLIFDESCIEFESPLDHFIVTPDIMVDCRHGLQIEGVRT